MRSIGIAAAFFAVVSIGATAGAEQLTITSAHPDPAAGILIIDGTGFRQGVAVALEGHDLKVLSVNPRQIRTSLPTLTPGTYRLAIRGWYEYGRFVIAIYGDATPPAQAGTPALTVVASNGHVVGTVVGGTPA